MHAGLIARIVKQELGFVILARNRIVGPHRNRAERISIGEHPVPKHDIVNCVSHSQRQNSKEECALEESCDYLPARPAVVSHSK